MLRLIRRLGFATLAGLATAYIAISGSRHWPEARGPWYASSWTFAIAVVVIGLTTLRTVAGTVIGQWKSDMTQRLRRQLDGILLELWRQLEPLTAPIVLAEHDEKVRVELQRRLRDQLGLHVFLVPRWFRALGASSLRHVVPRSTRKRMRTATLREVSELYLEDVTRPSRVRWRRGIGAIGRAWEVREDFYFPNDTKWAGITSEQDWSTLADEDKLGLTFAQAKRLRQYGQVMVVPVWKKVDETKDWYTFAGCVAADLPAHTAHLFKLDAEEVRNRMLAASREVAHRIP